MSKQLHSHEGVYTRTCGTCGPTANVNVLAVVKEQNETRWPSDYVVCP